MVETTYFLYNAQRTVLNGSKVQWLWSLWCPPVAGKTDLRPDMDKQIVCESSDTHHPQLSDGLSGWLCDAGAIGNGLDSQVWHNWSETE